MNNTIDIKNITVWFQTNKETIEPIKNVSLSVKPGETIGLWGNSGCGKTTLMKTIFGLPLEEPGIITGSVVFEGKPISPDLNKFCTISDNKKTVWKDTYGYYQEYRKRINPLLGVSWRTLFQEPIYSFIPARPIGEQIGGILKHFAKGDSKMIKALREEFYFFLNELNLEYNQIFNKTNLQLSGGECQRIMLAINLIGSPKFLFADEPTTALDDETRAKVHALIKQKQKETNLAIILASHNLEEITTLTDRIYVIFAGNLVETFLTNDIDTKDADNIPHHPYTERLLAMTSADIAELNTDSTNENKSTVSRCPYLKECHFANADVKLYNKCASQPIAMKTIKTDHQIACWLVHEDHHDE